MKNNIENGRGREALLYGLLMTRDSHYLKWVKEYDKVAEWIDSLSKPTTETHTIEVELHASYWNEDNTKDRKRKIVCEISDTSYRTLGSYWDKYDQPSEKAKQNVGNLRYQGKGLFLMGSCGRGKSWITLKALPFIFDTFRPLVRKANASRDVSTGRLVCYEDKPLVEDVYIPSPRYETYYADEALINGGNLCSYKNKWGEMVERDYNNADFFCVDDIGEEGFIQDYGNRWYQLSRIVNIWSRTSEHPIPIFSTNLSAQQLTQKYGDRFVSRIKSLFSHGIAFSGDDFRGKENTPIVWESLPFYNDFKLLMQQYGLPTDEKRFTSYLRCRVQVPSNVTEVNEAIVKMHKDNCK